VFSCFVGVRGFPKGFIVDQGEGDPHLIKGIQRVEVQKALCENTENMGKD